MTELLFEGGGTLFETGDDSNLIRRIIVGFIDFGAAAVRPRSRKAMWRRLLRDFVLLYVVVFLWLHFIGYRSWHPEFHRVRESLYAAATSSIPLALLGTFFSYLSAVWRS